MRGCGRFTQCLVVCVARLSVSLSASPVSLPRAYFSRRARLVAKRRVCGRRGASGSAGDARRRTRRIKSAPPRDTRSRTVIRLTVFLTVAARQPSAVAHSHFRLQRVRTPRTPRARRVRRVAGIRPRVRASRVRERDRDTVTHLTRSTEVRREKIMRIAPRRAQGNSASCATHTRFHHIPVAGQRYPAARARQRSLDAR